MSVKNIIACIERSHAVMGAHVQRLASISPELPLLKITGEAENSTSSNVPGFLNTVVNGHLQGAANALLAMAEVESHFNSAIGSETPDVPHSAEIIDVEATSVDVKEEPL